MSSQQSGEGEIRKQLVEDDLVDCMIALPPKLFYGAAIPVCLWFLARDKSGKPTRGVGELRDRRGETLFVDARKLGVMVSRTHRELTDQEIARIVGAYHGWRGEPGSGGSRDVPGFCKGSSLEAVREHGHVLTPGRYVGASPEEDGDVAAEVSRLTAALGAEMRRGHELDAAIEQTLARFVDDS